MNNPQDPDVTITLPVSAVNTLLMGLGELPAKQSMPLINHITPQVQKQLAYMQQGGAEMPTEAANDVAPDVEPPAPSRPRRRRATK